MRMDIEKFITVIKKRPVIYDVRHPSYKNQKERVKKWKEIASAMDVTVGEAKIKWKNLKDCYTRHIKSLKSTTAPPSMVKFGLWRWSRHLEFMKPHINVGPIVKREQEKKHETIDLGNESSSDVQNQSEESPQRPNGDTQRRHHRNCMESRYENECLNTDRVIQYLENKKKNSYDATELIFLGYAKALKEFSIPRQARIKMNIARMIMEEEVAHFEETTSHNNSDIGDEFSSQHDAYLLVNLPSSSHEP